MIVKFTNRKTKEQKVFKSKKEVKDFIVKNHKPTYSSDKLLIVNKFETGEPVCYTDIYIAFSDEYSIVFGRNPRY